LNNNILSKFIASALVLGAAISVGPANAQQLEEIVVTATKRAESAQSIPLSISAISGEELEARGVVDFFDYATTIPNLSFGAATDGVLAGRSISLRGIAGLNTTSVYIDDTPISESIDPKVLDLDRIEVLRGPTGTLYGARSLGGTIRQITNKPSLDETAYKVRAGFSSTNESDDLNFILSGDANIPLSDTVASKWSVFLEEKGGVFDRNVGTIQDFLAAPATLVGAPIDVVEDVDSESTVALQAAFLIQASDNLVIEPRVLYQRTELDGFPLADIEPENFDQNRSFNTPEFAEDEWVLGTFNINYTTDYGTFTSASSFFDRSTFEGEGSGSFIDFLQALPGDDGGFGIAEVIGNQPVPSPIFRDLGFETFVQEFRFSSDLGGAFEFVAGAFYQDIQEDRNFEPRNFATGLEDNFIEFFQAIGLGDVPIGELFPFGDLIFTSQQPTSTEELGIFGEVDIKLSDQWSLSLGGRFFDTEVSFSSLQAGLAFGIPLANDVPITSLTPELGDQSEDGAIFKGSIEYQATDDIFLFASVAEGFRIGGANTTIPTTLGCPEDLAALGLAGTDTSQFESDDLISYEIGIKSDLGNTTRLNATAFFIDFEGIQQPVSLPCGFQFIGNFGAAESQGFEVELTSQLANGLLFNANFGYTDAEFVEDVAGGLINSAGDPLQFVPEVTAAASLDYSSGAEAIPGYEFFARADISYVDESLSFVNGIPRQREAYEQVGVRLGLRNDKTTWTFFIDNLTDEIANLPDNRSLAAETPGRSRFVVSRPRTIGVQFNHNF